MIRKRLLVVDERQGFCEYVRHVAADLGYEVKTAGNMRSFRAAFESFAPTALFVDLVTLRSGVVELALWLSEEGFSGRMLVTGVMDETRAVAHLGMVEGLGPVTVLSKPVRLKDLRAALTRRKSGT